VVEDYELRLPGGRRVSEFVMRPWSAQELRERLAAAGFGHFGIGPGVGRAAGDCLFAAARL
jgi:hypothetical protein